MNSALLIVSVVLCVLVLFLGFLVLGTLRALGVVTWRVEQLEMITPSRIGRDGIKVGKKAPDFTLPSASNGGNCCSSSRSLAAGHVAGSSPS
jgi:hypothetical protein